MHAILCSKPQALARALSQAKPATSIILSPCSPTAALPQPRKMPKPRRAVAGFTLIELMIAVSVAGVLSSVAYPSFMDQVQRVRRTDAVVAVMQLQWAQERWRSNNVAYGSLAEIGMSGTSAAGYYTLQVSAVTPSGYDVLASATGAQARDASCAMLKLSMQGANPVYSSGPDVNAANAEATNRKCWSL